MNTKKLTVAILFWWKSVEHEVSIMSAKNIYNAIDTEKYIPVMIKIEKNGKWFLWDDEVSFSPECLWKLFSLSWKKELPLIDVVFPILHGTFGEDGTMQGLLQLANVPFVWPSVLGSAAWMDKDVTKRLLRDSGIPVWKFIAVKSGETIPDFEIIKKMLWLPIFIKPANLWSSVWVHKVHTKEEYVDAIKDAFLYDRKVLIEEYMKGREVECAVLGNEHPAASIVGEITPTHDFYSYEAKYLDDKGALLQIPAKMSEEKMKEIQDLAIKTFTTLECEWLGRVDFFLKENGEVFVNEINTLPGFTQISMYPKLWEASGLLYTDLVSKLIELAVERFKKQQSLKTNII